MLIQLNTCIIEVEIWSKLFPRNSLLCCKLFQQAWMNEQKTKKESNKSQKGRPQMSSKDLLFIYFLTNLAKTLVGGTRVWQQTKVPIQWGWPNISLVRVKVSASKRKCDVDSGYKASSFFFFSFFLNFKNLLFFSPLIVNGGDWWDS